MGVGPPGFLKKKDEKKMRALLEVKFISGSPTSNTHTQQGSVGAVRAQHSGFCPKVPQPLGVASTISLISQFRLLIATTIN